MSITGCILMKNEEDLILDCIMSLESFVDEIIIVDNGSTDSSVDIAKSRGCKVILSPNTLLDESRNIYLEYAKTDWVFVLDADERVEKERVETVISASKSSNKDVACFRLPWINYIGLGKFVEASTVSRFFRNDPRIRYTNSAIHASIGPSANLIGRCEELYFPIHHLDILINGRTAKKRNYYKQHMIEKINETKDKYILCSQYLNLGVELVVEEKYEYAISMFNKAQELHNSTLDIAKIYIAQTYLRANNLEKAKRHAIEIIETNSMFIERAYCIIAEVEYLNKNYNNAIQYLETVYRKRPNSATLLLNLSSLIVDTDPQKAIDYIKKAIEFNPYLLKKEIYVNGEKPNIFSFQSSFLPSYENLFVLLERAYTNIGDYSNADLWNKKGSSVLVP